MYRNVSEVNVIFEQVEHSPTARIRQFDVQCNGDRIILICKLKHFPEACCNYYFKVNLMRFINHDLSKAEVIFYNKYNPVLTKNIIAIVPNFVNDLVERI